MKKQIAKKTIILYVLMMLQKGSSPEHPITQTNIANVINSMGIPCDRKTVGRNIDYLIDFGYKIKKIKGGGCYIEKDTKFEEIDTALLKDEEHEWLWIIKIFLITLEDQDIG